MGIGKVKTLIIALVALNVGSLIYALAGSRLYGDMPDWAEDFRLYHIRSGDSDYLASATGCELSGEVSDDGSVQCAEAFVFVGPDGRARLALAAIGNVQSAGEVGEARAFAGTVGAVAQGHIGKAVVFTASCYGNVEDCIGIRLPAVEFTNGWRLTAAGDRIELTAPDGTLRDVWR